MMALAPPRLSITIDWPSAFSIPFAMALAFASVAPPGGNGTISRIGRVGHCPAPAFACCALASAATITAPPTSAAIEHHNEYRVFIVIPPRESFFLGIGPDSQAADGQS